MQGGASHLSLLVYVSHKLVRYILIHSTTNPGSWSYKQTLRSPTETPRWRGRLFHPQFVIHGGGVWSFDMSLWLNFAQQKSGQSLLLGRERADASSQEVPGSKWFGGWCMDKNCLVVWNSGTSMLFSHIKREKSDHPNWLINVFEKGGSSTKQNKHGWDCRLQSSQIRSTLFTVGLGLVVNQQQPGLWGEQT